MCVYIYICTYMPQRNGAGDGFLRGRCLPVLSMEICTCLCLHIFLVSAPLSPVSPVVVGCAVVKWWICDGLKMVL